MTNFAPIKDKELFFKVVLLSTLTFGVCSSMKKRQGAPEYDIKINSVVKDNFSDFDRANVPNRSSIIAKMIYTLKPGMGYTHGHEVAEKIHQVLKKHNLPPQVVLAIIDTESSFKQDMISSTGDLSMAQVNVEIWNKEFVRMNLKEIDSNRIYTDEVYSLEVMAQILDILKTRYEKKDRRWYARYHSKTGKHKRVYLAKLETRMKRLEKLNLALIKKVKTKRLIALSN